MPFRTLLTILGTAALVWGLHMVPQLDWVNGPDLATLSRVLGVEPAAKPEAPVEPPSDKQPSAEIVVPEAPPP